MRKRQTQSSHPLITFDDGHTDPLVVLHLMQRMSQGCILITNGMQNRRVRVHAVSRHHHALILGMQLNRHRHKIHSYTLLADQAIIFRAFRWLSLPHVVARHSTSPSR
jgi:hypothetical protein